MGSPFLIGHTVGSIEFGGYEARIHACAVIDRLIESIILIELDGP